MTNEASVSNEVNEVCRMSMYALQQMSCTCAPILMSTVK